MSYRSVKGVSLLLVGGLLGCLPLTASAQIEGKYGAPRSWSGGRPAGPFSTVDLRDGNLFTAVPLVGFSGRGPSMHIALYHNASTVDVPSRRDGSGWILGDGWSMSYGARLDLDSYIPEVLLIEDDSTGKFFMATGQGYEGVVGVHDTLEELPDGSWKVTAKDQSYRIFASDGLLESVVDSSGNTLTVNRDVNRRIESVVDAAGRSLIFSEIGQGAGLRILDDGGPVDSYYQERNNRWWDITSATGLGGKELQRVDLISTNGVSVRDVQFTYDADVRIDEILDADSNGWSFDYTAGRIAQVNYPASLGTLNDVYDFHTNGVAAGSATKYTDYRGNDWWYEFEGAYGSIRLVSLRNPLNHTWSMAWDSDNNMTSLTEPSPGGTWTYTYDSQGNLLTASDPIPNTTTYTYDSYNNLRSVTNPLNHQWQYFYESTVDPTLLTSIVEPDDGQGNGTATTNLAYYSSNGVLPDTYNEWPNKTLYGSRGGLQYVEDPNGVVTAFRYDRWGQLSLETEGNELHGGLRTNYTQESLLGGSQNFTGSDSAGRAHLGSGLSGSPGAGGEMSYGNDDATDEITGSWCMMVLADAKSALVPVWQQPLGPYPTVPFDEEEQVAGWFDGGDAAYSRSGRLLSMANTVHYPGSGGPRTRSSDFTYDALGRARSQTVSTDEVNLAGAAFDRTSTFTPYDQSGYFEYQTEDGTTLHVYMDEAGQVDYVQKGSDSVAYIYRPDGRLDHAEFAGGLRTDYTYYANGAIEQIITTHDVFDLYKKVRYVYDAAGQLTYRYDYPSDGSSLDLGIVYTYDNRGRLIRESTRRGVSLYTSTYTYDNGGNRKTKEIVRIGSRTRTDYFYDVDADTNGIETYGSKNNRLVRYEVTDILNDVPLETVWYVYNRAGNVSRILSQREGSSEIRSTRFEYDGQGQVWRVLADKWDDDGVDWAAMPVYAAPPYVFGLTDEAMTWHEAKAFAESHGLELAHVPSRSVLQWLIDYYSPADGQETSFWLGGEQDPNNASCGIPGEAPWACWYWRMGSLMYPVSYTWKPEPDAAHDNCPLGYVGWSAQTGAWLPNEPDDGGQPCLVPPDVCSDCGVEDHMVLTLNAGNVPGLGGLADVNSSGLHRALFIAEALVDPVLPGYERLWAMEYRYSTPRQRYYWAHLDPRDLDKIGDLSGPKIRRAEDGWTDYFGDSPLVDYQVDYNYPYDMVNDRTYLFGAAETDAATGESAWRLSDHLGTATHTVLDDGQQAPRVVRRDIYSAFGELVYSAGENAGPPPGAGSPYVTRYGYAGAHGYQQADMGSNGAPTNTLFSPTAHQTWAPDGVADNTLGASPVDGFPFLHLGHRLYDPATGRFLQRDPIGIRGGLNVYVYVGNAPTALVDPWGLCEGPKPSVPVGPVDELIEKGHLPPQEPRVPRTRRSPDDSLPPHAELAKINRRFNYAAAGYATCAALTWWCPPVAAGFAGAAGIAWGMGTSVYDPTY